MAKAGLEWLARAKPGGLPVGRHVELQLVPGLEVGNGKKRERAHIRNQPCQRGAAFVAKAPGESNGFGWIASGSDAPPRPRHDGRSNVVLTAFLA